MEDEEKKMLFGGTSKAYSGVRQFPGSRTGSLPDF